jgi:tRNA(Glu) U13 pseudouridine synthase TruD
MKKEILIVTVLITNLAFASSLPIDVRDIREPRELEANKNTTNTLTHAATSHLYNRGLEKEIANKKVLTSLVGDKNTNDLMAKNVLNHLNELKKEDIVAHVSDCALYSRNFDLSAYDDIIGLVQKRNGLMLDDLTLAKVEKISLENKHIKLLQSVSIA